MTNPHLPIPKELLSPFFYLEGSHIPLDSRGEEVAPFIHEVAYFNGITMERPWPWETPLTSIPNHFQKWEQLKKELQQLFDQRQGKAALEPMKQGIAIFIEVLHWTNQVPVVLHPKIDCGPLEVAPFNVNERLDFIMNRPTIFPSFKQLVELMHEIEKGYRKKEALGKFN